MTASIPVKPYLLKFLQHVENLEPGTPLDINNGSTISFFLKSVLISKLQFLDKSKMKAETMEKEFTARLNFVVVEKMKQFNKFFYTRETITTFNTFLYRMFHDFLLEEIRQGELSGKDFKEVIYNTIQKLDIDDDISFDGLKKANYRLRISKKIAELS